MNYPLLIGFRIKNWKTLLLCILILVLLFAGNRLGYTVSEELEVLGVAVAIILFIVSIGRW